MNNLQSNSVLERPSMNFIEAHALLAMLNEMENMMHSVQQSLSILRSEISSNIVEEVRIPYESSFIEKVELIIQHADQINDGPLGMLDIVKYLRENKFTDQDEKYLKSLISVYLNRLEKKGRICKVKFKNSKRKFAFTPTFWWNEKSPKPHYRKYLSGFELTF